MIFVAEIFRRRFREIGITSEKMLAERIFTDPAIKPWRVLDDRENCTWDITVPAGPIRLHVKRFPKTRGSSPAELEANGYHLLEAGGIPTLPIAAHGSLEDGRSFIATEDLAGFSPADKLLESGFAFDRLLAPTADLAARLHRAELHHRDLYLCHFMVGAGDEADLQIRLIDAARVRPLPGALTRRRWIVKDLAQFWYSTLPLKISDAQRNDWLARYGAQTKTTDIDWLRKSILRKSAAIASHDARLRRRQPLRNISIPGRS